MKAPRAMAGTIWLSLCLAASAGVLLSLHRPEPVIAVIAPRVTELQPVIFATTTVTEDLAAILAAELLLDPVLAATHLPAIMR